MNHQETLLAMSEPHPHDVIKGKGRKTNEHPGNKNFRRLVKAYQKDYVLAPKEEKHFYVKHIIREIQESLNPPGRFLAKNEKTNMWHVMSKKMTEDKTRQALREGAPRIRTDFERGGTSSARVCSPTVGAIAPSPTTTNTLQATIPSIIYANGNFLRDFRTWKFLFSSSANQTGCDVSSSRVDLDHLSLELDWLTSNGTQQLSQQQLSQQQQFSQEHFSQQLQLWQQQQLLQYQLSS